MSEGRSPTSVASLSRRRALQMTAGAGVAAVLATGRGSADQPYDGHLSETAWAGETVDARNVVNPLIFAGSGEFGTQFDPAAVLVRPHQTVSWEWQGGCTAHNVVHDVAEQDREFNSGEPVQSSNVEYTTTVSQPGVYPYRSESSGAGEMRGVVVVGEENVEGELVTRDVPSRFVRHLNSSGDSAEFAGDRSEITDRRGRESVTIEGSWGGDTLRSLDPAVVQIDPGTEVVWEYQSEIRENISIREIDDRFVQEIENGGQISETFTDERVVLYQFSAPGAIVVGDILPAEFDGSAAPFAPVENTDRFRWRLDAGSPTAPTIADGTVFVGSYDDYIYALDAASGTEKWAYAFEDTDRQIDGVTYADGTVYATNDSGKLAAIDAEDGTELWGRQNLSPSVAAPTVADGTVFYTGRSLMALDAADGTEQWTVEIAGDSTPVTVDGTVYAALRDGIYAFDSDNGTELWSTEAKISQSSPTVEDGVVYVGGFGPDEGIVYALNTDDGSVKWTSTAESIIESSPTVKDGTVFIGGSGGYLYALDADDGTKQWEFCTGDFFISSPTVVDETVFVGSNDGNVYAVDAESGTEKRRFVGVSPGKSSPTVADGTLYVSTYALESGVEGSSNGSRARLGTLGHHVQSAGESDDSGPGFGVGSALAALGGASYLLQKRRRDEN